MRRAAWVALFAAAGLVCAGCSVPIDNQLWRCTTSADCGSGWQCDPGARTCVEAYDGINGVFDDRLVFGLSAVLSDDVPSLAVIGRQALQGVEAYFKHINGTGGIHGRKLELRTLNDSYLPEQTAKNIEQFVGAGDGPREVFLVCNTLGTPTSVAAAEVALRERVLLWAPGTGLAALEPDPPNRYVFHFRPRFSDEAEQITDYLRTVMQPTTPDGNIWTLAQGTDDQGTVDLPGGDVLQGVSRSLGIQEIDVVYGTYEFNKTEVTEPVRRLLEWMASEDRVVTDGKRYIGLTLGAVWDAGAFFIRTVLDQLSAARTGDPLDPRFGSDLDEDEVARLATVELRMGAYSGITTDVLTTVLKGFGTYTWTDDREREIERRYGAGLIISQTVPSVTASASGVLRYLQHLAEFDPDAVPGEFSLEVYLNMWLLGEALQAHGRDLTTETFVETLQTFTADLGVGTELGFTISSHQATSRVWGLRLDDGLDPEALGLLLPE